MDVPGYLRLIAQGKPDEAHAIIREKVPFPGILGRVCTHPCETACRRGEVNEPISICALKRYAADGEKGLWKKRSRIEPDTGKNIAVIGSGPAGLTAAFYLRKQGHGITVFESRAKAGGMMRYGIPTFRLPRAILDQEIGDILALGIDIRFNHTLGKDFTLEQLKDRGYDAVFLGIGAQLSRSIQLNGSALTDVLGGVDFLVQVAQGAEIRLENRVVVIGGGNVAVDVALTALRCGANDVTMVCLECQEEMPAHASVLKEARSEGVKLRPSWGPGRILRQGRQITGMELIQCRCVFDDQGNFCPEFGEAKEKIEVDQVIMAIGQTTDLSFLGVDHQISNNKGLIVVDLDTFETPLPGVYAGGDVTALAGTLIHAIAAGRKAAASIDRALGGTGNIDEVLYQQEALQPHLGRDKGFASWPREHRPALEVGKRHTGFQEIVLGYTTELAVREAKRCLQCDLRLYLACNPSPPKSVLPLNAENIRGVPETEGVFQLLDETHRVLIIKGTPHLRRDLLEELERSQKATLFAFEEDKMYSKRESELIQRYLQEYGEMPGGEEDDDLF
jgi:NADPH-dependent glutamate synthase beta subunit-like oxidoreductase